LENQTIINKFKKEQKRNLELIHLLKKKIVEQKKEIQKLKDEKIKTITKEKIIYKTIIDKECKKKNTLHEIKYPPKIGIENLKKGVN
jgi:hypothetical protein